MDSDSRSEAASDTLPANSQPEAFVIPRELAQATLDYLAMRPYREVFPLIRAFEELEPLPSPRDGE